MYTWDWWLDCSCYCSLRLTLASPNKLKEVWLSVHDHVLFDGSPLTFILISGVQGSPCLIAAAAIAIIHNRNGISIMGKTDYLYEYIKSHNGYSHSKVCSMIPWKILGQIWYIHISFNKFYFLICIYVNKQTLQCLKAILRIISIPSIDDICGHLVRTTTCHGACRNGHLCHGGRGLVYGTQQNLSFIGWNW